VGLISGDSAQVMWVRDTLRVEQVLCSEAYLEEARGRDDLEIQSEAQALEFDQQNQLVNRIWEPSWALAATAG
jgi:hypothetical protein